MDIKQKLLSRSVTITGKNFLNKRSAITFAPYSKLGWWWKVGDEIIPIDWRIARYKKGRVQLFYKGHVLNVWEHIGILRFLGIDCVLISADTWPPYYTALEYFTELSPYLYGTEAILPVVRFPQKGEYASANKLGSYVVLAPQPLPDLRLEVVSQWEDLPENKQSILFSKLYETAKILEVLSAKPQGLSKRKVPAKVLSTLGIWGHMRTVSWKSDFPSKEVAAIHWGYHRMQDFLGELSLVSHTALPIGAATSYMAGHRETLSAINNVFS